MSKQQLTAEFHGTSLNIIPHNNHPYVSAKQISEAIGIKWVGQYTKLNNNPERWGIKKILIPSISGNQETICLPLRKLSGWLMTIQPNKVSPELRPRIIQFQNECDDVLADHWEQQQQPAQAANATPLLEQTGAMALSPVKLNHAEQDILQTIAGHLAAHSHTDEAVTITVALQQSEKAVVKALIGELTVFQNTDLKPFITHYNNTVKLSTDKYDALNTLLRAGSFIERKS